MGLECSRKIETVLKISTFEILLLTCLKNPTVGNFQCFKFSKAGTNMKSTTSLEEFKTFPNIFR